MIHGMMNKEIAAQLGFGETTVKAHLSHIFKKLKVSRRLPLLLHQIARRTESPSAPPAPSPCLPVARVPSSMVGYRGPRTFFVSKYAVWPIDFDGLGDHCAYCQAFA